MSRFGASIVASTHRELLVFDSDNVKEALSGKPILITYGAYLDRVRGMAYMVKRGLWRFWG